MTTSLETLEGAGIMNNTFCLGIFFFGLYINTGIEWDFTAETVGIVIVEAIVAFMAQRKCMRLIDGVIIMMLYPLSLVLIAVMQKCAFLLPPRIAGTRAKLASRGGRAATVSDLC